MNEYATVWGLIIMLMVYCVPMLRRMDELEKRMYELEKRIAKMEKHLDHIEKALYVMPDDGGAE